MGIVKKMWTKVKWIGECLFVWCIVFPIAFVMFYFWQKEYEKMNDDRQI